MSRFSVILPAAGKGERFGGSQKKTFARLNGRPVFLRSIELFISRQDVCQTILVVGPEDFDQVKSEFGANFGFMGIRLVKGGERRCDSVAAALAVVADEADFVAVHDAARPCLASDQIDAVFAEAIKTQAAILAAPLVGTIKRVAESGVVEATVSRTGLFEAQTPQVFKKTLLVEAYDKLGDEAKNDITDDAQVVELTGHPVTIVICNTINLKITTKADLTLAQFVIKARPPKPVPKLGAFEEAQW